MLSFIKLWHRSLICSIRTTPHYQSPLVSICIRVFKEVVQQNLCGVKIHDSFTEYGLHHWILGLCTHSMSYDVCYIGVSWHWQRTHIIIHPFFNPSLSLSCCLTSLLRTRIPRFGSVSKFPKRKKKLCIYIVLLQIQLGPLGYHQRKLSLNHPIYINVS